VEAKQGWQGAQRTDSSTFNHVSDGESLDRLILGRASRAVGAADGLYMAAAFFVAAAARGVLVCWFALGMGSVGGDGLGCSLFDHGCGTGRCE